MITPRGPRVQNPMAMILDAKGHLIWAKGDYGQVYNLKVQKYKGNDYLTFWAGDDTVGGHGAGYYHMLDHTYREVYKLKAAGGLGGDLHEFRITDAGTALISVYEVEKTDLSNVGGKQQGKIWDCLVQEISIETGELVFEWHAAEHFHATESAKQLGTSGGATLAGKPFDYFHMNSIDKDPKGNYLVSSRYMRSITYFSGKTGQIIWVLGGSQNMFRDLSGGSATNFAYQHNAEWHDDYTTITVFDNAAAEGQQPTSDYTRGLRIKLDEQEMTAELVAEYINPNQIRAISQGSIQIMENGNVFMGYGNSGAFTEFAPNGTALCDTHMGPQASFGSGDIQSYRAFKYEWHGYPTTKPNSKLVYGERVTYYVSWNGATEIARWVLQAAHSPAIDDQEWEHLNSSMKVGFESSFELRESCPRYLRSLAIDKDDKVLGVSEIYDAEQEKIYDAPPIQLEGDDTVLLKILMGFSALTGVVICLHEILAGKKKLRFQKLHYLINSWAPVQPYSVV
ncbi:secreted protein [Phlyctema vagabunda]|uniref:Secreted protein n=1 Tax=Phlyctema vagabunda TaxID=108571 RepID=A0ABR4PLV9_9HELO